MKSNFAILTIIVLLAITGRCEAESPAGAIQSSVVQPQASGCTVCHKDVQPDKRHNLGCVTCHKGNSQGKDINEAHAGLIVRPASPQNMAATCGKCHPDQVTGCGQSLHFTVKKAVNLTRSHFGLTPPLDKLTEIPQSDVLKTKEQLVNDMLRRRCLRCHVYTPGDSYAYVRRGTGCASCHLQYTDGKLDSHTFIRPGQRQCLSCHYGNHVGTDFIGRYEHDYNWEYRTPYTTKEPYVRPYGVELHQLVPDIHQQRGLTCVDCHSGSEMAGKQPHITCLSCHEPNPKSAPALPNLRLEGKQLILQTVNDRKDHPVPQLRHPAHAQYNNRVSCQVCHAQWGFNDRSTHLLLSYVDDVDPWERLTVQSSSFVEQFLEQSIYGEGEELEPAMPDSITGALKPGIWFLGFTQRRWEEIQIRRDSAGIIRVFRPILDIRISAVDEDNEVIVDNLVGNNDGLLPYTPHTTGPAGLFYEQRFLHLLNDAPNADKNMQQSTNGDAR